MLVTVTHASVEKDGKFRYDVSLQGDLIFPTDVKAWMDLLTYVKTYLHEENVP